MDNAPGLGGEAGFFRTVKEAYAVNEATAADPMRDRSKPACA
jgi:hypothetical protein